MSTNKNKDYVNKGGDNDLFEGALARTALAALIPEQKKRYQRIGEELYGTVDFEGNQSKSTMGDDMLEAVAYVETQIVSGLHPSMLEQNEKDLLKDAHGDEWYKKWGYTAEDLDDIVTLVHN